MRTGEGERFRPRLLGDHAWSFEDESDDYADAILERLSSAIALVQSLWALDVANVLLVGERRDRISAAEASGTPIVALR